MKTEVKQSRASSLVGYLLIATAVLLYLVCAAAFVAMFYALTVSTTIAAVESAFGSFVAALIFLGLGRLAYLSGRARIKPEL